MLLPILLLTLSRTTYKAKMQTMYVHKINPTYFTRTMVNHHNTSTRSTNAESQNTSEQHYKSVLNFCFTASLYGFKHIPRHANVYRYLHVQSKVAIKLHFLSNITIIDMLKAQC